MSPLSHLKERLYAFLRFSERYTKTDMVYLTSGGFWLTLGQGAASLSALVLSVLFANLISPELYGTYKYVLSIAGVLAIFTLGGMHTALARATARGEQGVAHAVLKSRLLAGTIAGVFAFGFAFWNYHTGNEELAIAFGIVGLLMPLMEAFGTYDAVLQGLMKFRTSTAYFTLASLITTIVLATTLLIFPTSLTALLLAYFGSWTAVRYLFWKHSTRDTFAVQSGKDTVRYGIQLTGIGALSALSLQLDKIILFYFLGPVQLAVYTFAIAIPEQVKSVLKGIIPLALTRFSKRTASEIRETIHRKALKSFLITLPLVVLYIVSAPYIYATLFPAYLDSIAPSQLFSLSLFATPVFLYLAAFQSQQAKKLMATSEVALSVVQISALLILIPLYGLWGAVIARLVTRAANLILSGILVKFL